MLVDVSQEELDMIIRNRLVRNKLTFTTECENIGDRYLSENIVSFKVNELGEVSMDTVHQRKDKSSQSGFFHYTFSKNDIITLQKYFTNCVEVFV